MKTYDELQLEVRASIKEIDLAIALASLSRRFDEDERIAETFDNTYEANPFVLCRSSIEYCLALTLVRCHDHRRDSHGLTAFFEMLDDDTTPANLREGILTRRREWVGEDEAQRDTEEHLQQIETAHGLHNALRGSHQYGRVKSFRHSHIAHRARETRHVQPTHREHFYELTDSSKNIVQILCGAVLGTSEDFEGGEEIWEDYTRRFFNVIMGAAAEA